MGLLQNIRKRVGLFTAAEAIELWQKANPVLPSLIDDARYLGGSAGVEPLDQDFEKFLKAPGLFVWVSACVDAIATAAAAIPLKVMQTVPDGSEEMDDHPLLQLLEDPNPEQGLFSFWYGLVQQMGYTGECYVTSDAPFGPDTSELWHQRSDRMKPVLNKGAQRRGKEENPISHWIYDSESGKDVYLDVDQVIQIKKPHPTDPFRGLSPLKHLETILNLEYAALRWNRAYFKNGASASVVVTRGTRPSDQEIERFREQFSARHSGYDNAFRPMMLWGEDMGVSTLSDSPTDASFMELLQYAKEATLAVYKCPPFVVALPDGTTWSNSREQKAYFYNNAVIPINRLILDTLNSSPLVRAFGDDVYLVHDYSNVEALQDDKKAQAEVDSIYLQRNVRTINEVRQEREFGEPVEWGDEPQASPDPFGFFGEEQQLADDGYWRLVKDSRAARAKGKKGDARALRWKAFVKRTAPIERAWAKRVRGLFGSMLETVLDNLREQDRRVLGMPYRKADDDPVPFDWQNMDWLDLPKTQDEWLDELEPLAEKTLQAGAEDILQEIDDLYVPFDVTRPEVAAFIRDRMASQIKTILQNRQAEVRAIVTDAAANGRTIGQLEQDLRDTFGRNSRSWSVRIARTESAGLYNAGAQEGMKEAGVTEKEWLSARDSDVRETHSSADGTAVALDALFYVGDASGPAPGQMSTAAENINCRCTIIPGDV